MEATHLCTSISKRAHSTEILLSLYVLSQKLVRGRAVRAAAWCRPVTSHTILSSTNHSCRKSWFVVSRRRLVCI